MFKISCDAGFRVVFVLAALVLPAAAYSATSLCLTQPSGCTAPGSTVNVQVRLGPSDATITGVQFRLDYDPDALFLLEASPGANCDPASPFQLEIHQQLDETAGTLFLAVGVDFTKDDGTTQPATVACIRFLPRGPSSSDLQILVGAEPGVTRVSDNLGKAVPIDNSAACPSGVEGVLSTRTAVVDDVCQCVSDADCETLDGACRLGVCDTTSSLCRIAPVNENGACDDLNPCTTNDRCTAGVCAGSGCTHQSLCLIDSCSFPGSLAVIPLRLGEGDPLITGGQFSLQWDPAALEFVDVKPGWACDPESPFTNEIKRVVDASGGELFFAVGIALDNEATSGPATLACLYFNVLEDSGEVCLFDGVNPFHTRLVDHRGQRVSVYNDGACPSPQGFPFLGCIQHDVCALIPTTSHWGLLILTLALLIYSKLQFRPPHPSR